MKQKKLPYEVALVEVVSLLESDLIATSGEDRFAHVEGDEGSWV